jgi:hypothetical protein
MEKNVTTDEFVKRKMNEKGVFFRMGQSESPAAHERSHSKLWATRPSEKLKIF